MGLCTTWISREGGKEGAARGRQEEARQEQEGSREGQEERAADTGGRSRQRRRTQQVERGGAELAWLKRLEDRNDLRALDLYLRGAPLLNPGGGKPD